MRNNCPVCDMPGFGDWEMDFIVPDGWTLPTKNVVKLCDGCGMIWYDNDRTQADYDKYYLERYGFDGSLDPEKHVPRWEADIRWIACNAQKDALIVDYGGGTGYITKRLNEMGFERAVTVEIGGELPFDIDLILSVHVLEHIYDVRPFVQNMIDHLAPNGRMMIEVPDASTYGIFSPLPMIDYIQVHINHFIPGVLDKLLMDFGYYTIGSERGQLPEQEASMYRVFYAPQQPAATYYVSKRHVRTETAKRLETLKKVTEPVIVWGFGPYCAHMLARAPEVFENVVHFVDIDPAFNGATIHGKEVLDYVISDVPILVIAQQQATGILAYIEKAGLKNKVIVI